MGDPETTHTITMSRPDPPYLVVLEPDTQYYYLPPSGFEVMDLTLDDIMMFLDEILEEKSPVG